MDELGKIKRVVEKQAPVTEVLLVLDATTGQNGVVQARVFTEAVTVTGVVLTKLDGTAKGGIVVSVQQELGIPVKLIGLGEGPDDLAPFEPRAFAEALVGGETDRGSSRLTWRPAEVVRSSSTRHRLLVVASGARARRARPRRDRRAPAAGRRPARRLPTAFISQRARHRCPDGGAHLRRRARAVPAAGPEDPAEVRRPRDLLRHRRPRRRLARP